MDSVRILLCVYFIVSHNIHSDGKRYLAGTREGNKFLANTNQQNNGHNIATKNNINPRKPSNKPEHTEFGAGKLINMACVGKYMLVVGMTIICADYSDDTEVTSIRNQNKVAFLDGLRDKLDMPKPKKSKPKPKGGQFRSAAKKKESVKGVYIHLTF